MRTSARAGLARTRRRAVAARAEDAGLAPRALRRVRATPTTSAISLSGSGRRPCRRPAGRRRRPQGAPLDHARLQIGVAAAFALAALGLGLQLSRRRPESQQSALARFEGQAEPLAATRGVRAGAGDPPGRQGRPRSPAAGLGPVNLPNVPMGQLTVSSSLALLAVLLLVAAGCGGGGQPSAETTPASVVLNRNRADFVLTRITKAQSAEELLNRMDEASLVIGKAADELDDKGAPDEFQPEADNLVSRSRQLSRRPPGDSRPGSRARLRGPDHGPVAAGARASTAGTT